MDATEKIFNITPSACNEIHIQAEASTVWNILTNINGWPEWVPDVSFARLNGPLAVGTKFIWKSSGFKLASIIVSLLEKSEITWIGKGLGARALHVWRIKQTKNGTVVISEEYMRGWLVKLLKKTMADKMERFLTGWLQALKEQAEK